MSRFRVLSAAVLVLALVGLTAPATAQEADFQTTKGLSQPIYTQSITEEYWVPTSHGTIYGWVTRPVVPEGVKVPVILTYSPYGTQSRPHNDVTVTTDSYLGYYVPRGYARAWFDLVGTRESSGCYDYGGIREQETGKAVVDFLGTRSWSNGRVGMIGASYDGTTAYAAAVAAPEHLTTIVPQVAIDRWYDYPYDGGVRRFSGYGTPLLFDFAFGATPATDPDNPTHAVEVAADRAVPCDRVEHQIRGYEPDPIYDSFYDERDYRAQAHKVKASVLIEGGWLDSNVQPVGSIRFFQALPDDHPKKLVMGQWGHATPTQSSVPDWRDVRHAWFDYWLLGYDGADDADDLPDTGVMNLPRVDSVIPGNQRFQFDTWPPPGTSSSTLSLGGATADLSVVGATTYNTADVTVQQNDVITGNCRGACVVFLGRPLADDVRLSGTPFLDLVAKATPPDPLATKVSTQIGAILFAQLPTGQRQMLSSSWLNSRNRNGVRVSQDASPRDPFSGTMELDDLDRIVPAGSRLGVAFASYWLLGSAAHPDDDGPTVNEILSNTKLRLAVSAGSLTTE